MHVPRRRALERDVDADAIHADAEDLAPRTDVEISTMKWNGENWISASKPELPETEQAEKPKKKSECVPNCTVLVVTAK